MGVGAPSVPPPVRLVEIGALLVGGGAAFVTAYAELAAAGVGPASLAACDDAAVLAAAAASEQPHWFDWLLARACLTGDRRALDLLDSHCIDRLVPVFASKGLSRPDVDALLQDVRAHLVVGEGPALLGFSGRGSLRAFVRTASLRLWLNARRGDERRLDRESVVAMLEPRVGDDESLRFIKQAYAAQYAEALQSAWSELRPEQRLPLRQHLLSGMSIDRIAAFHRIHRSSAARRVVAARDALIHASKVILAGKLGLSTPEVESVLRLVRSRLELELDELG